VHECARTRASESDRDFFLRLNRLSYQSLVEQQFGAWDEQAQLANFAEKWKGQKFSKVFLEETLIGGIWVEEFEDYLQIFEIQLLPEFRNRGLGTTLIEEEIGRARLLGKRLRLRVLHLNPALSLYTRLGFRNIETTEHQYIMELG